MLPPHLFTRALVTKLDRLARSAQDLYRIISQLDERVVGLRLSRLPSGMP